MRQLPPSLHPSYSSNHFNLSFDTPNVLLVTAAMLSLCPSSLLLFEEVEKYRKTSRTKWITVTISIFQAWNVCSYRKSSKACSLKDEMVEFSKQPISWKITLETMTGNVAMSEVDTVMYSYVVLSKVEEHLSYEELFGTTECVTLYPRWRTTPDRHNRVQLYMKIQSIFQTYS